MPRPRIGADLGRPPPSAGTTQHRPDSTLLSEPQWSAIASTLRLSVRELQIVREVFDNRTQTALAGDLGMSRHTANTHLERLYHKLDVNTRVTLVLRVLEVVLHRGHIQGDAVPVC